eukprot:344704-Amorphochlora_amoeboformis.AAC.1
MTGSSFLSIAIDTYRTTRCRTLPVYTTPLDGFRGCLELNAASMSVLLASVAGIGRGVPDDVVISVLLMCTP